MSPVERAVHSGTVSGRSHPSHSPVPVGIPVAEPSGRPAWLIFLIIVGLIGGAGFGVYYYYTQGLDITALDAVELSDGHVVDAWYVDARVYSISTSDPGGLGHAPSWTITYVSDQAMQDRNDTSSVYVPSYSVVVKKEEGVSSYSAAEKEDPWLSSMAGLDWLGAPLEDDMEIDSSKAVTLAWNTDEFRDGVEIDDIEVLELVLDEGKYLWNILYHTEEENPSYSPYVDIGGEQYFHNYLFFSVDANSGDIVEIN